MVILYPNKNYFNNYIKVLHASGVSKMTEKTRKVESTPQFKQGEYCKLPERSANHFCSIKDPGIVVDVEIQAGDPVDSQFIRDFMSEFKAFYDKRSA